MKCPLQPFQLSEQKKAFTLIEVVIAMAVTTFSVITLMALLPVGLSTAQTSRRETRAAYLAEQIVGDLRSSSFTSATILSFNSGALANLPAFSLATASTNILTCDGANNVLATASAGQYATGVPGSTADYLVQVTVVPTSLPNLSSVSVEVSTPAQAALSSRSRFGFLTMIGNRQ